MQFWQDKEMWLLGYLPRMNRTWYKIDIVQSVCSPAVVSKRIWIKFSCECQMLKNKMIHCINNPYQIPVSLHLKIYLFVSISPESLTFKINNFYTLHYRSTLKFQESVSKIHWYAMVFQSFKKASWVIGIASGISQK